MAIDYGSPNRNKRRRINRRLARKISWLSFCLFACLDCGQARTAAQLATEPSSDSNIQSESIGLTELQLRGVVVDENNKPIAKANIRFLRDDGRLSREEITHLRGLNLTTANDGSFEFTGIPIGCQPVFSITDSQNEKVGYLHLDETDKVKGQDDLRNLRIRLVEGSFVQGKVLFDGKPIPNQVVKMNILVGRTVSVDRAITYEFQARFDAVKTNEAGEYRFENVFPDSNISIYTTNSQGDTLNASSKSAKPGEERFVKEVNFLTLTGEIEGIVVDSSGEPVKGAGITVMDPGGGQHYGKYRPPGEQYNVSGADGRFKATHLPYEKLWLWVSHPRDSPERKPSAQLEIVGGEMGIKVVLDERLGQKVKKRK